MSNITKNTEISIIKEGGRGGTWSGGGAGRTGAGRTGAGRTGGARGGGAAGGPGGRGGACGRDGPESVKTRDEGVEVECGGGYDTLAKWGDMVNEQGYALHNWTKYRFF